MYSVHSPGTESGLHLMERMIPLPVEANSIRPECDMTTLVNVTSGPAGISNFIYSSTIGYHSVLVVALACVVVAEELLRE